MKEDKKKERFQGLYVKWDNGKETKNMKLTEEIFSRGPEPLSCVSSFNLWTTKNDYGCT